MAVIDYRYKLAQFKYKNRTIKILAIAVSIFIVWDIAGILSGIFFIGSNDLLVGIRAGEFPIEELLFLVLLNYVSLLLYLLIKRRRKLS
jgi:lycopene cyclase domain-containing protein